jgi:uncharacterized protein YyaL (SSP411 family)
MPNRLANENSPYLLQHANNPVDWYPWGDEALTRSRLEDKPIFLSIGYSACHWCHVMEHESFEDPSIAALMNDHFICIKVDREERPDLDSIYMSATVALTGSGGWPMSVFLSPDLRPFYAGTYFPPVPRFNMPSFRDLLLGISNSWQNEREEVLQVGTKVTEHIQRDNKWNTNATLPLTHALLDNAADQLIQSYDWGFGGWGEAPKFPQPMAIEFLFCRATQEKSGKSLQNRQNYLKTAVHALNAMSRGGMFDVVGGGFARYSVDNLWKTPHFEKMLYDNAQLALVYLHGYLLTGDLKLRQVCERTLDFLIREMRHPAGGFYSSLDADSEGQEGKYYVWDYAEIESILKDDFEIFKTAYGLSENGNTNAHGLERKIILQRVSDNDNLASRFKLTVDQVWAKLEFCHARLLEIRNRRIHPAVDDKVLTFWNALALTALAEAGCYLDRPDYLDAAAKNASFILKNLSVQNRLLRSWRAGNAKHNATLEDYASLIVALLTLYQSDPNPEWYANALKLSDEMVAHFSHPNGGFFDIRDDHEALLLRPRDIQDNATPSGNGLAAHALLLLAAFGDRPDGGRFAEDMLAVNLETALRYPTAFSKWLVAADFTLGPTHGIAIVGNHDLPETQALLNTLWSHYHPRQVVARSGYPPLPGSPALLLDRPLINGLPSAYVCQGFVCQLPVTNPLELANQLGDSPASPESA